MSFFIRNSINAFFDKKVAEFTNYVYENTGLKISYDSLSPSILSSFYINGIEVSDDNGIVAKVDRTKVDFDLFLLLNKDFKNGIHSVLLSGIDLDLNELLNILERFKKNEEKKENNIDELLDYIPKDIKLKNINLTYNTDDVQVKVAVKDLDLSNKVQDKAIGLDFYSKVSAYIPSIDKNIKTYLKLSGAITKDFNNSQLTIGLENFVFDNIHFDSINLFASYNDDVISIHTIQSVSPFSVGATYNLQTTDVSLELNTDNIELNDVLSSIRIAPELEKFLRTKVTTSTKITSNLNEKTIDLFSYNKIILPETLIPGGMNLALDITGDEKHLEIKNISFESEQYLGNGNFNFIFDNLQLSGVFQLPYFLLPNGKTISTELYVEPMEKGGFNCFSPQLFIGDQAFTGIDFSLFPNSDAIDFILRLYDYSHLEEDVPGIIKIDGSFLTKSKYLQTSVSLNTFYLDSITNTIAEFLPAEQFHTIANLHDFFEPFVLSGDIYLSTDLKSLSYNVPYILLANSKADDQVLMISLNGTEQSVQINQLSLVYGDFGLQADAFVDKSPDSNDIFFDVNVSSAAVPYHFSGTFMPGICTVVGDYGTSLQVLFNEDGNIDGFLELNNLPLIFGDLSLTVSANTELKLDKVYGPMVKINRFETEIVDGKYPVNPKLSLSGNATKYGVQLDTLTYSDYFSSLDGRADFMLDITDNLFESARIDLNLRNPISSESININGNVSNLDRVELNADNLIDNLYVDLQVILTSFSLNRFAPVQSDSNFVSGSIYASGLLAHPYISASIEKFSMIAGGAPMEASGNILLEDRDISVIDMKVNVGNANFDNIEVTGSLNDFSLEAGCDFYVGEGEQKVVETPLKFKVSNAIIPVGKIIPDTFTVSFMADEIKGSFLKKTFPVEISAYVTPMGINIYSSKNIGLNGFITSEGILELNLDNGSFLKTKIDGFVSKDVANFVLYDLNADLSKVFEYINLDQFVCFEKGILTGEASVTGSFVNPDIDGNMEINNALMTLPFITPAKVSTPKIKLNIVDNVIEIPDFILTAKSNQNMQLSFFIYLNKWLFDFAEGKAKTVGSKLFPGNLFLPFMTIAGDIDVDLDLFLQNNVMEITGDIYGDNMEVTSGISTVTTMISNQGKIKDPLLFKLNFDIVLGTHASISFSPILRCILVPNTKFNLFIDPVENIFTIDGELKLRTGDVAYLNRSFYIKTGAIKFNVDDMLNPIVTLIAETREHDSEGKPVKIIFEVENQQLLDLKPKFRAEPAKSEEEVKKILGQIVVGDSENATDLLFSAGDYAFQSTFIRKMENKLRNLLNFDIFSVRTNVLKNALNMTVSGNLSPETFSIGNFLDNSTVYIGKYLGSSLYLDAMLHLSFEKNSFGNMSPNGTILFQPEFGLELESPFANIRFNLAPDINALIKNNQFVPSPSVTLSWDFTF